MKQRNRAQRIQTVSAGFDLVCWTIFYNANNLALRPDRHKLKPTLIDNAGIFCIK